MALKGIKVLEFSGLAPGPLCGKILADFGASVVRIDKHPENPLDILQHGKRTLALNIKNTESQVLIKSLCKNYDVLIEPYRPGVMERNRLGPVDLLKENPRLIYARLTGFGQNGILAQRAGHDINYLAISGILSLLGRKNEKPTPPVNLMADFAGGGVLCALGICMALLERTRSGIGQVIDSSMVEGAAYVASWLIMSQNLPILWGRSRGDNLLDSGKFYYDTYETKDGKYMSVGALEPQFFEKFIEGLGIDNDLVSQSTDNVKAKEIVEKKFLEKTQEEWSKIFENNDACVYPVLDWKEAWKHSHNKERKSFKLKDNGNVIPEPSPKLIRTPGKVGVVHKADFDNILDILSDIGKTAEDVKNLIEDGVLLISKQNGNL
ncbi:alpha-methylacyl-CoA racemase [Condylostylus longicornis]|uniref:alpha-methylacyl-CoA racemase n=1 Tax=Condylostylus longicornis TaxID=2530218 RepID=UPI00244E59E9|nr:alpha-methylacyl-CoA racemase [Condylostylus longicornis]